MRVRSRRWEESRSPFNANVQCRCRHTDSLDYDAASVQSNAPTPNLSCSEGKHEPDDDHFLYEPFVALWRLIRLDPSVVQGEVSAATVLERLKLMAEQELSVGGSGHCAKNKPGFRAVSN